MNKILLLGGNGYIGSKLYPKLCETNQVDSVDLCLFGADLGYSKKIDYSKVDVSTYDTIICLAGHSSVQMSEFDARRSWKNNVENFIQLCEKLSPTQMLIYASSASVYGSGKAKATEETSINFHTINNYDMQKITCDLIANRYIKNNRHIVGLRFGTVNGSSPNTRKELMLNSMVKNAIETNTITIKNLSVRRAILGIDDLINAILVILDKKIPSGQYNLSSFNSNVQDMANAVSKKLNARINTLPDDPVSYDFEMDTSKFQQVANFKFTETIDSIIDKLITQYESVHYDNRDNDRDFKHVQ